MKTKSLLLNKIFLITLITACFIGFIFSTDPNQVALPFLVIPFVLLGFIIYQLVCLVFLLTKARPNKYLSKIIALSIASLGLGLLLLQSLHQLTWKDSLLTGIFAFLFWLYIWRADFLHQK